MGNIFSSWFSWGKKPEVAESVVVNELEGKPLSYLIGANDKILGAAGRVIVVPYDSGPAQLGISVGYCNLFDENNTGKYGPYLHTSDTAKEYNEGQIDPKGRGWVLNLKEQLGRRKRQGFEYIELDNADSYDIEDVFNAISTADIYGLKVIAKNPCLFEPKHSVAYIKNSNVYGIITEDGCGDPWRVDADRRLAGKPNLPMWFVSYGKDQFNSVIKTYKQAKGLANAGVTWSRKGEYGSSEDLLVPRKPEK